MPGKDKKYVSVKLENQRDKARKQRDFAVKEKKVAEHNLDQAKSERDHAIAGKNIAERKVKELLVGEKAREQFVVTLSHDLRNPLATIKSAMEAIQNGEDIGEMLSIISRSVDLADELIHHLLDANLIKSGRPLPLQKQSCSLSDIVSMCVEGLPNPQKTRVQIDDRTEVSVGYYDPFALTRALKNLVVNAIKYGHRDELITIKIMKIGDILEVSVHNFGPAIPLIDQSKIFDGFYRSSCTDHLNQLGWGLGLVLVKGIAEAHDGRVEVDSNAARGTTFTMMLPI